MHVTQSMSKAGCPYDNAPMERYFNTLKNKCTNLHEYDKEEALYQAVEEFAYVEYNYVRPHSHNDYATPYEVQSVGSLWLGPPALCFSYFNSLIDIGLTETRLQEHRSDFIPSERSKTI